MPATATAITGAVATLIDTASGAAGTISTATGSGLSVALASDSPAAANIPASATANTSATNVPYLKFNLTASADGAITVNSLTVTRTGVGSPTDFSYVYLYDGSSRLTTGRTVNSTSNKAIFSGLNYTVSAGTTKTLTLVADIGTNTSGNDAFEISAASDITTSGAAVSGSFPVKGNTMTLASVTAGKLTVTAGADPSAPSVGAKNVNVAQFKLAAANEDINLHRIALYQGGSVSNSNLANFELYYGSTKLATVGSISSTNLISFVLTSPFKIEKGQTKTFDVKADIGASARNADTIYIYIENAADVYGIGATYGYGVGVDYATTGSGTYDGTAVAYESNSTISGGQLTFSSNGPVAANVRGTGVNFLNFSVAAGVNTEFKSLRLELYYGGVKGTASGTSTNGYITNVRIVDTDSNATVWGPIDLGNNSSWTDIGTTGSYHNFTETVTVAAGTSRNFKVLADLNSSLSAGPLYVVLGSTASAWTLSTTAGAKNTDNNQWVTNIVPSSYITGSTMTFTTSALTVSAANSPATKYASQGDTVEALGIVLAPATNATAKVTSVKVAGYLGGSSYDNFEIYDLGTDKITDTVSSVSLWDGATQIGLTKSFGTDGYATFDNLNVTVPSAGKTLVVKATISSTATTTGAFGIAVVAPNTDVTAYDENSNAITPSSTAVNVLSTTLTSKVGIKMTTGGSLTGALNSDYPSGIIAAGTSDIPVLSTKFYASNQAMKVTKMRVTKTDTNSVSLLSLTYAKDAAGTLETATTNFVGSNADFTNLNIYVPKDDWSRNITAKITVSAIGSGSTSGDTVYLGLDSSTNFEAVAAEGGTTKATSFTGTISGSSAHTMTIRKAIPTFTTVQSNYGGASYAGQAKLAEFKVSASNGSIALKKIKFNVTVSDGEIGSTFTALTATDLKVYRSIDGGSYTEIPSTDYGIYLGATATSTAGNRVDSTATATGSLSTSSTATSTYIVFDKGGVSGGEEVVSTGSTNTYIIAAVVSGYVSSQDSINMSIASFGGTATIDDYLVEDANYYVYVYGVTAATDGANIDNIIWSDNSAGSSHTSILDDTSATADDWINGYKVTIN